MDRWYMDSEHHLFGSLDAMLEDIRANIPSLPTPSAGIDALMSTAEQERAAIDVILKELSVHHTALASVVDELQRALSVAGAPLRGEIS